MVLMLNLMKNENLIKIKAQVSILRKLITELSLDKPISYDEWKLLHSLIYDITYNLIWLDD